MDDDREDVALKAKIKIRAVAEDISLYNLEGHIESVIAYLQHEERELKGLGWEDLKLEVCYPRWEDDQHRMSLTGIRWENAKEYKKRLDHLVKEKSLKARNAAEKEIVDQKEYKRLKKKYGDK